MLRSQIPLLVTIAITTVAAIATVDFTLALADQPIPIQARQWLASAVIIISILTGCLWRSTILTSLRHKVTRIEAGVAEINSDLLEMAKHQVNGPEAQALQAAAVQSTLDEIRIIAHTELREIIRDELHYVFTQNGINKAVEEAMIPTLRAITDFTATENLTNVIRLPRNGQRTEQ